LGRNQSPVRRPVWLWYTAPGQILRGSLPFLYPDRKIYLAQIGTGVHVPNVRIIPMTALTQVVHLATLCDFPHTNTHVHTHAKVTFLIYKTDPWEHGDSPTYQETNRDNRASGGAVG
jgi:hypothetical protein